MDDARLDELGRALVEASAMTDAELDALASPFLYSRVKARIAAERERRAAMATWLDLLLVGRRTMPAMVAVAIALAGWLWIGTVRSTRAGNEAQDPHVERFVLAGTSMFSDDDLLTFLINWPAAPAKGQEEHR